MEDWKAKKLGFWRVGKPRKQRKRIKIYYYSFCKYIFIF